VKRIMDSHDPDGGEGLSVPDPRKRSPFEAPVILTSAPRSSFFSATLVQTRLATPRPIPLHRPVLVTPQKRLIETTPASPPNPSQDLQIPDLASPRYQPFSFPTHSFPLPFPPSPSPLLDASPRSSRPTTSPSAALFIPFHRQFQWGPQAQQLKCRVEAHFICFPRGFPRLPSRRDSSS
jgi:hypothetical protein